MNINKKGPFSFIGPISGDPIGAMLGGLVMGALTEFLNEESEKSSTVEEKLKLYSSQMILACAEKHIPLEYIAGSGTVLSYTRCADIYSKKHHGNDTEKYKETLSLVKSEAEKVKELLDKNETLRGIDTDLVAAIFSYLSFEKCTESIDINEKLKADEEKKANEKCSCGNCQCKTEKETEINKDCEEFIEKEVKDPKSALEEAVKNGNTEEALRLINESFK